MKIELRSGNRLDPETVAVVATMRTWAEVVDHANTDPIIAFGKPQYVSHTDMLSLEVWLDLRQLHTYVVHY